MAQETKIQLPKVVRGDIVKQIYRAEELETNEFLKEAVVSWKIGAERDMRYVRLCISGESISPLCTDVHYRENNRDKENGIQGIIESAVREFIETKLSNVDIVKVNDCDEMESFDRDTQECIQASLLGFIYKKLDNYLSQ